MSPGAHGSASGSHELTHTVTPGMRRVIVAVLVPLVAATVAGMLLLWPTGDRAALAGADRYDATILNLPSCPDTPDPDCVVAEIRVEEGPDRGAEIRAFVPYGAGAPEFAVGDAVVVIAVPDAPLAERYEVYDFQRAIPLLLLAVLFALAVVALSRWRGLAALTGLALSILVLTMFVLPALLEGTSPLAVAVVGASAIMIVTLYLSHGFSAKTSVALIGTLISLSLTGVLGYLFTEIGQFTGLADDQAGTLGFYAEQVDVRGLLLAGLVIGALGVLDDVTVSQSATVLELARAAPDASRPRLFAAGLRVGRDHVAATVNTLVLAYAGASLPLLLLFTVLDTGITDVVTMELVAQEVVRALVGSLGIVAAVPVTTGLAAVAFREGSRQPRGRRALRPVDTGA
jgi:uncharacterized membrane protein